MMLTRFETMTRVIYQCADGHNCDGRARTCPWLTVSNGRCNHPVYKITLREVSRERLDKRP